jgi:hypothetical protein
MTPCRKVVIRRLQESGKVLLGASWLSRLASRPRAPGEVHHTDSRREHNRARPRARAFVFIGLLHLIFELGARRPR